MGQGGSRRGWGLGGGWGQGSKKGLESGRKLRGLGGLGSRKGYWGLGRGLGPQRESRVSEGG